MAPLTPRGRPGPPCPVRPGLGAAPLQGPRAGDVGRGEAVRRRAAGSAPSPGRVTFLSCVAAPRPRDPVHCPAHRGDANSPRRRAPLDACPSLSRARREGDEPARAPLPAECGGPGVVIGAAAGLARAVLATGKRLLVLLLALVVRHGRRHLRIPTPGGVPVRPVADAAGLAGVISPGPAGVHRVDPLVAAAVRRMEHQPRAFGREAGEALRQRRRRGQSSTGIGGVRKVEEVDRARGRRPPRAGRG